MRSSEAKAPAPMLGDHITGPIEAFPYAYDDAAPKPSLLIRAIFNKDEFLLCFNLLHNAGDANSSA